MRLPNTPEPTHWFAGTDGLRLAGDVWGDPDGTLVVLQHGGGQTRHAWKDTGERLGRAGYRVIAFDARGHGDSDWDPEGRYSRELMASDLRAVVGDARPVLVGASMGGITSLTAIGLGLVDAAALVLVDIAPMIDKDGQKNIRAFMRNRPDGFDSLDEVAQAIASYQPHRKRPRNLDGLSKNVRLGADGKYKWHWDPRYLAARDQEIDDRVERLSAFARKLTAPALLVRGGLSDVLSEEAAEHFLSLVPHSEYVSVKDAAHMVAGDRNDVFGNAMIDFLARVAPPRASTRTE